VRAPLAILLACLALGAAACAPPADSAEAPRERDTILALGRASTTFTRERLLGRQVALELDVETRDRFGRLLAYVWLPDGTLFNATLLEAGQARLLTIPPNVRYVDRFRPLERAAREARRGLWASDDSRRGGS
jgi:micrococcal nuclease